MILRRAWLLLLSFLPLASAAQSPEGVPLAAESHHHLSMQNDSVAVYQFELAPHAATPLHHHDKDYISIAIGGALVTRAVPGQPEAQRKLVAGEISFAR